MCSAANYTTKNHYFGRNFDYEISYNEQVMITPRNYPLKFRKINDITTTHYAIIGISAGINEYPLYYDATNEKGLSMAGLNFTGYTKYHEYDSNKLNITPFEFIPYILSKYESVDDVKEALENINLVNINYSDKLPLSPLHWIISDSESSITVECLKDELKVYDNPLGILTNNPPFDLQMFNLNNYRRVSNKTPSNDFLKDYNLDVYSRGMGGMGIPGDLSSMSRFVKLAFTLTNSWSDDSEESSVNQFFHILASVEQQNGCTFIESPDKYEYTIYSSCVNTSCGIYYYRTYGNSQINAVNMHNENLDTDKLITYPLVNKEKFNFQN